MSNKPYWFPAKKYGYGWGTPVTKEGWFVMVGYIVLVIAISLLIPPDRNLKAFLLSFFILTTVLIFICWKKGEPPKWRWGDDS